MKPGIKQMLTVVFAALTLTLAFASPAAHAADSKAEKSRLRSRAESRYPEIRKYKSAGKIGETSDGLLDLVKASDSSDDAIKKLVNDENADRQSLYKLIAADQGTSADAVARKAAQINFRDAKKGDFLKDNGQWRQK